MKITHPALQSAIGAAGAFAVRKLVGATRFHFRYADPAVDPAAARRLGTRYIYAFFHEVMLFPAYYWAWPEMNILISDHRDGELITRVVRNLGFGVVRGSTTRGGARALREMTRRVDQGHLCVTPDGPKGPRRSVQPGLIYLSSKLGLPIVGAGMAFESPWRAQSWDRFAVPRPLQTATCVVPSPIVVPPDADRDAIERYRLEVEQSMNQAMIDAEAWVQTFKESRRIHRSAS